VYLLREIVKGGFTYGTRAGSSPEVVGEVLRRAMGKGYAVE
jgi:hypothetical protein